MFKKKVNIYCMALIAAAFIFSIISYNKLPELIPTHWNIAGEVDAYSKKPYGAFMAPFLMAITWLGMIFLPKIDPKKENYKKFESSYDITLGLLTTFFFGLHMATLLFSLGYKVPIDNTVFVMMGIMFVVMGNYMPKAKSNYFYGIKTPWTLSNEVSWRKTHRLAGKLFVISGFLMIVSTFLIHTRYKAVLMTTVIVLITAVPIVASYFYAKDDLKL